MKVKLEQINNLHQFYGPWQQYIFAPQLKVPQNLGDEASPAGSDAVQTGCLRKQVPHNGGGEGQVGVSEPVAAGDEGQSRAAEFGT